MKTKKMIYVVIFLLISSTLTNAFAYEKKRVAKKKTEKMPLQNIALIFEGIDDYKFYFHTFKKANLNAALFATGGLVPMVVGLATTSEKKMSKAERKDHEKEIVIKSHLQDWSGKEIFQKNFLDKFSEKYGTPNIALFDEQRFPTVEEKFYKNTRSLFAKPYNQVRDYTSLMNEGIENVIVVRLFNSLVPASALGNEIKPVTHAEIFTLNLKDRAVVGSSIKNILGGSIFSEGFEYIKNNPEGFKKALSEYSSYLSNKLATVYFEYN